MNNISENKSKLNIPLLLLIILLAANMRANYTGIGTFVHLIQADLGLNAAQAGMITTIPILIFAVICPLTASVSGRFGIGRLIEAGLIIIMVGGALRAVFGTFGLFTGTVIMSIGIGIMNALMIALIKLRFPDHAGTVTSAYTTTMAVMAAVALGASLPIAKVIGWRGVLSMWSILTLITVLIWGREAGKKENFGHAAESGKGLMRRMLKAPKAWMLMVFMGTQSLMFYCITAWMPSILRARGMDPALAANMAMILQILSLPTTLLIPILAEKVNRMLLAAILDVVYVIGAILFYLNLSPASAWLSIVLIAIGMGSGFSFCIFLFSKCSHNAAETSALSGFAQSGGYIISGSGPVIMGALFDRTQNWNTAMIFCFIILLIMVVASLLSNIEGYVLKD